MKESRIYNERQPWDALPGETSKAYYAFSLYRGLGPKRSIREVADLLAAEAEARDDPNRDPAIRRPPVMRTVDLDELRKAGVKHAANRRHKKAWGRLTVWCTKHKWVERAAAWDREVDEFVRERQREEIARMRVEGAAIAKAYAGIAAWLATTTLRRMNTPEGRAALEKLPLEDLIGLSLILGPKVGRILEAVRAAHGVYVEKPKRGDNNGDQHVWYVEEFQPERPELPDVGLSEGLLLHDPYEPMGLPPDEPS